MIFCYFKYASCLTASSSKMIKSLMRPYVGYGCRDDTDMILQPSRDRTWQQSIIQHVKCHNVQNEHISLETQRRKGLSQFG